MTDLTRRIGQAHLAPNMSEARLHHVLSHTENEQARIDHLTAIVRGRLDRLPPALRRRIEAAPVSGAESET